MTEDELTTLFADIEQARRQKVDLSHEFRLFDPDVRQVLAAKKIDNRLQVLLDRLEDEVAELGGTGRGGAVMASKVEAFLNGEHRES
jgi:hypothetical protein